VCEEDYGLTVGSGPIAKKPAQHVVEKVKGDGFSTGEKDLYREFS
jgi:hypothetical protein